MAAEGRGRGLITKRHRASLCSEENVPNLTEVMVACIYL